MSNFLDDFLNDIEDNSEERELLNLSNKIQDLSIEISTITLPKSSNFYDELNTKIRLLVHSYVLDQENTICSPVQKCLYLFHTLFNQLSNISFMNKNFLLAFLYKRTFAFYESLNPQKNNDVEIINNSFNNLTKDEISPIIFHCLNFIVDRFIFDDKKTLSQMKYLLEYFNDNSSAFNKSIIQGNIFIIYFSKLICLDDSSEEQIKQKLKDEQSVKEFIENKITQLCELRELNTDDNSLNMDESNINTETYDINYISFLFKHDFNESKIYLSRYLRNAIIKVFTPVDQNILNYFQTNISQYLKNVINAKLTKEANIEIDLDKFGELFLNNHIQDVDIKIRNLSFLIDIILQKFFKIEYISELDLMKFPRLNIIMNRLFIEKNNFKKNNEQELINAIFEHFIISQFMYNYIKYQVKDPEHYPIEIRYFVIYSYIKISEDYLITNPFSSYITSITFMELIKCLKLEIGFHKQKYIKNSAKKSKLKDSNINNNDLNFSIDKSSQKKSIRKRSISRTKKNKKKNKRKSVRKSEVNNNKNSSNMDIDMIENLIKTDNESKSKNNESKSKLSLKNDDGFEQPNKLISIILFNYLCFIYSMETKFNNFSKDFAKLYTFIDEYIIDNIKEISIDTDWTWINIYSIKFIKSFDLTKTFEKFKNNSDKENSEENIKLISFLSKKIKYCNTQERYLILDVIYYMLINFNDLPKLLKTNKYYEQFKKLIKALTFLSFNTNFSINSSQNMSLINEDLVGEKLFKITNLLFIESLDEYFWIPKNLRGYKNFNDFIQILEKNFNKSLYRKSLYSEQILKGLVSLKKYMNRFMPNKNQTKKEKEMEQYILSLDYFCQLKIPYLDSIQDLTERAKIKRKIFELMKLMPDEYDLKYDLNEKVDLLTNILLSGEYDLTIILFLIMQLIANKKLEENSKEVKLIISIFKFMINTKYKSMINFILTIYKSIEKYLLDLIDEYVQFNFAENLNFSKKEYTKFLDLFNPNKQVDANNKLGKEIQIINNNWKIIQNKLEETDAFFSFLDILEEMNYPKSVMNLIEKYIFDMKREYNIHNFNEISEQIQGNKNINDIFKKYLNLYYKAYSHIDDNKIILDNYFENNALLKVMGNLFNNDSKQENKLTISSDNNKIIVDAIHKFNQYMISLDSRTLITSFSLLENIEATNDYKYIYFKIIGFFYYIYCLNKKEILFEERKNIFFILKKMEKSSILNILEKNNKLNEANNSINYSLWLYELSLYLKDLEIYISKCSSNSDFINNMNALSVKLRNIFINKRKIPHVKRFLFIFEFRRFLFNLIGDKISELYCLMDICKVYKSIYETGISIEEESCFKEFLKIYSNILIELDNKILINIDKKLFFIPLKYYVKFFDETNVKIFDELYNKYESLYQNSTKNSTNREMKSYKITILKEKFKAKNGVVGVIENLLKKIKEFGGVRKKNNSINNLEGLLYYTDFYLDLLLTNEVEFQSIKPREKIYKIQIYEINDTILNYLENAINICIITDKEKYLRKYMPEIINLFFKINLAHINYIKENNLGLNNSFSQTQSLIEENIHKFAHLLDKFKKEVSINKVKIIIPQLIISYQYEDTYLYKFAIELLALYAEQNIDLIAYLLSSFLNFRQEDLKTIGIKAYRNDSHSFDRYKNYLNTFEKSKKFVTLIKEKLSVKNQKILMGYEEFCQNLCILFFESKRMSNLSKKEIRTKQSIYINNVNVSLKNNNIILPTLENINRYNSSVRNIEDNTSNNKNNNILFLDELDSKIDILSSKEKPMHIRFKTRNISKDLYPKKYYDFLLKCDVNDITKEIKTFEIIDEINNIFKLKHYNTNESMSLKRYLIVPIAPTIILAEWLNDCISFSSVIEEQSKKDLIYQDEYKNIIHNDSNKPYINPGSISNEEEKFNILYNYYQYNFFNPNLWYNAKKKYIISTAIWSMTQFLVGLGDRHPGNIMFNKTDGEVVHIDFGYVALKGLSLGVPEIVEFRLTFNLRKNLGLFEENGLFNYICVKVLKTFKEYYKTLSARIEYYQFDPLFDNENDNKTFKLFDQNDKFFSLLDNNNVKIKVKELIVKNTNPENLEKMYIWWSPWV